MDQPTTPAHRIHSRSLSYRSDKSADRQSQPAPPTPGEKAEKHRRDSFMRGESKANPNAAINEAQPQALNVIEKVTLDSLRDTQHKDIHGNVITEPDLSNPTRPRWERPLDTIRSFEKAIDGGYKRRSMSRAGSDFDASNQFASRRSSYFGGYESGPSPSRHSQYGPGFYGRQSSGHYDQHGQSPNGPAVRQRYGQRGMSDSGMRSSYYGGNQNMHPQPPYHHNNQSYDNTGSDSTGPWHNSTDPSSENSSLDRVNGTMKTPATPEPMNNYGLEGFGGDAIMEEGGSDDYGYPTSRAKGRNGYGGGSNGAPPVPSHSAAPRQTIQLGGGGGGPSAAYANQGGSLPSTARQTPQNEKRKSWLGRKFSRKD